jgi:hypothetical protein
MPQDIVYPANTVIVEDNGLVIEEFEVGANATEADMIPGTWVIPDTVEDNVKESSAKAHGLIGLLMEMPDMALTDHYTRGSNCRVITGGNGKVMVRRVASAGQIDPETPLVTGANGTTDKQAVGAAGTQGDIVGFGSVTLTDSTAIANVVIRIHKQAENKAAT